MKAYLIAGAGLFFVCGAVNASNVITAENMVAGYQGSSFASGVGYSRLPQVVNEATGQRITTQVDGLLTRLDASIIRAADGEPLNVSICLASGAFLPGPVLGSVLIPYSQVRNDVSGQLSSFDLSSMGVHLEAHQHYVFTFTTATALPFTGRYNALLTAHNIKSFGDPYISSFNGGEAWQSGLPVQNEVGIRVFVEPTIVPEPSTAIGLAVCGGIALIGYLRGRQHSAS